MTDELYMHVAIDMGDGTVYLQRTEPTLASGMPLADHEQAILRLYAEVERLKGQLAECRPIVECVALGHIHGTAPAMRELAVKVLGQMK